MKNKLLNIFRNKNVVFLAIIFLLIILSFSLLVNQRMKFINNPLTQHFLTSWNSFKKIYNIVHVAYWVKDTTLPVYYLNITYNKLDELNSHLPIDEENSRYGDLFDEYKHYVEAVFSSSSDNYHEEIEMRYRGLVSNNWDAEKKAIRIKFPKDNLFNGKKALNLFLPGDRAYFAEVLSAYRAKKLGIFSLEFEFVRLYINNRDFGVYLAAEAWSNELLARNSIVDTNNIFSNKDQVFDKNTSLFLENRINDWKSYTAEDEEGSFDELETLLKLITLANDEEFAKKVPDLVDLDKIYKWQMINVLAGSNHQGDPGNSVLLFRKETGKFEVIPWDVNIWPITEDFYLDNGLLIKRILNNQNFFEQYNDLLKEYIFDDRNLEDDLVFYDNLKNNLKIEFYKDQAKIDNDYQYNKRVEEYRDIIVSNFENAKKLTALKNYPTKDDEIMLENSEKIIWGGSFVFFDKITKTVEEFLSENRQFQKRSDNEVVLTGGIHVFTGTVIIPRGLKLIIEPGAYLCFAPEVSLISYSSVTALGHKNLPITFQSLYPGKKESWGVFGVINSGSEKNIFDNIIVSGGSETVINGVDFTSQFSLHNTFSEIRNSIFENNWSDDGLHAILGTVSIKNSIFRNNESDGIDFDFIINGEIKDSTFYNDDVMGSNGDAIDISGGKNTIVDNRITSFGDKCISVGEKANVVIKDNTITSCVIGVAVKDSSFANIKGNIISENNIALSLYRKKQEFIKGGEVEMINNIFENNNNKISKDEFSSIVVREIQ